MSSTLTNFEFIGCPVCGDDSQTALDAAQVYHTRVQGAGVCGACAERIANAFQMQHSGEWLTWTNEARTPKYTKAKIGPTLKRQVHEKYQYRCVTCLTHLDLTCDHIIPESKGGPTTIENLQTMCQSCNSKKGVAQ